MDKDIAILLIAKKWFGRESLEKQNNSSDFEETAVWCIEGAIEDAYAQGVADTLKAPATLPRSRLATDIAGTDITVYSEMSRYGYVIESFVEEYTQDPLPSRNISRYYFIPQADANNMDALFVLLKSERVDVFRAICEHAAILVPA
jgi:hypothetical protein